MTLNEAVIVIHAEERVPLRLAVLGDDWLRTAYDEATWWYDIARLWELVEPKRAAEFILSECHAQDAVDFYGPYRTAEEHLEYDERLLDKVKRLCPCPTLAVLAEAVMRHGV